MAQEKSSRSLMFTLVAVDLERDAHLLRDGHEQVVEDFEPDRIGVGADRLFAVERRGPRSNPASRLMRAALPAGFHDNGRSRFIDNRRAGRRFLPSRPLGGEPFPAEGMVEGLKPAAPVTPPPWSACVALPRRLAMGRNPSLDDQRRRRSPPRLHPNSPKSLLCKSRRSPHALLGRTDSRL